MLKKCGKLSDTRMSKTKYLADLDLIKQAKNIKTLLLNLQSKHTTRNLDEKMTDTNEKGKE